MTRVKRIDARIALVVAIALLPGQRLAAQECYFGPDDMDDIQRLRNCLERGTTWDSLDGWTMLHFAARYSSNPAVVSLLLDAGFHPNAKNDDGWTPLHLAARYAQNPVALSVLVDGGADPNVRNNAGRTALHLALDSQSRLGASILLDAGAEPSAMTYDEDAWTPLHLAAVTDDPLLIATLLDRGANPVARSADGRQPIHSAAYYTGNRLVVSTLLRGGAGAGMGPLHLAVLNGNRAALNAALAEGADPNTADDYGWTPLHFAALVARLIQDPILVSDLVTAGADPDARDHGGGMTPLDNAVLYHGGVAVVEALLAAGAEPGRTGARRDNDGHTPLHHAAMAPDSAVIASLVAAGASVDVDDLEGNKPSDYLAPDLLMHSGQFNALARLLGATLRIEGTAATPAGTVFQDCLVCPELVVVPAGSFMMGSPYSEQDRYDSEGPQRRVTIGSPFAVGVYEVTFHEWDMCVAEGGCAGYRPDDEGWGRGILPVIHINWEDAQEYVQWLSRELGEQYRLLSEAEWEYVARAGTRAARHWGASASGQCRNGNGYDRTAHAEHSLFRDPVACSDGYANTAPAGALEANAFGLHDVLGNVWEWTEDCWNEDYSGAPIDGGAWRSGDCSSRVVRGGSWRYEPRALRSASRGRYTAGFRDFNVGFRVARTLN